MYFSISPGSGEYSEVKALIIRINGQEIVEQGEVTALPIPKAPTVPTGAGMYPRLKRIRRAVPPATVGLSVVSRSSAVFAAAAPTQNIITGLMPIVQMIQDLAFPVGLGVGIWGLIEYIMDNPAGKEKVKRAVIGYIGIFVLPSIFLAIRNAFKGG